MTFTSYIDQVRAERPLVHHITNYVTVNDCANACLAIGASPVMADAVDEAESMVSIAQSLVLNIGTLNVTKVEAMMVAGRKANALGIPVVLTLSAWVRRLSETVWRLNSCVRSGWRS